MPTDAIFALVPLAGGGGGDCITLLLDYLWRCLSLDDLLRVCLHVIGCSRTAAEECDIGHILPGVAHDQRARPKLHSKEEEEEEKRAPAVGVRIFGIFRIFFSSNPPSGSFGFHPGRGAAYSS
jgi:hypothetical protein